MNSLKKSANLFISGTNDRIATTTGTQQQQSTANTKRSSASVYDQFNFFNKVHYYDHVLKWDTSMGNNSDIQGGSSNSATHNKSLGVSSKQTLDSSTNGSLGQQQQALFGNLSQVCVTNDVMFLMAKSPPKLHAVSLRGTTSPKAALSTLQQQYNSLSDSQQSRSHCQELTLLKKHNYEKFTNLFHISLTDDHEYLILVASVEDTSVAVDINYHQQQQAPSLNPDDMRNRIAILLWRVSDLRLLRRIDLPRLDASHVKSVVAVHMEHDHPNRMALAFHTTDQSKSDVFIVHDPLNVSGGLNASAQQIIQQSTSSHIDCIKVHRGAGVCGLGFAWYSKKTVLYVASEKALWRVDLEKKTPSKVCNLRSGKNKDIGSNLEQSSAASGGSIGCRVRCVDVSSAEFPVFLSSSPNGDSPGHILSPTSMASPTHSSPGGGGDILHSHDIHQFVVAALSDKIFLYDCNQSFSSGGIHSNSGVELDYQATLTNKTKICCLWFNNYLILQSKDSYNRHILSIYSLSGRKFKAYEQCFARNQTIEDITTIGDRCIVLVKTVPQHQSSLAAEYSLVTLEEKNMKSKLGILTKKFKYDQALGMALSYLLSTRGGSSVSSGSFSGADMFEEEISEILKKSGDFMFSEGEYDRAIKRYLGEDLPMFVGSSFSQSAAALITDKIRVEPSAVIRKFLDAQANEPLTKYLVKLHEIKQADAEHTKLLLECYIRDLQTPKTEEKHRETNALLNQFLNQSRPLSEQVPIQMIAIKTLRRAGYRFRALSQAYKEPQNDKMIIQIEVEDYPLQKGRWNYKRALAHLETLRDFETAVETMEKYGSVFLRHIPQQATNVMIRLCTPHYKPKKIEDKKRHFPLEEVAESMEHDQKIAGALRGSFSFLGALDTVAAATDEDLTANPNLNEDITGIEGHSFMEVHAEKFIKSFAGHDYWLMVFLESVIYSAGEQRRKHLSPIVFNTLLEIYLKYMHYDEDEIIALPRDHKTPYANPQRQDNNGYTSGIFTASSSREEFPTSPTVNGNATPTGSSSNDPFADAQQSNSITTQHGGMLHLSDVPQEEKILTPQQEKIMRVIKHYDYSICPATCALGKMNFQERIMTLLEMDDPDTNIPLYDLEHALVLVQSADFEKGILLLYAKLNLHYDILQFYKSKKDYQRVVSTCEEHGQRDPNIWIQVLTYFAEELKNTQDKESAEHHLKLVLSQIKKRDILPPLMVVQVLSRNDKIEIGLIKDYLQQKLEKHQQVTEKCNNRINTLQNETNRMSKEIHELKTSARVFQKQKCCADGCGKNLDLPAIHFMCMHSYHQRCLPNEEECPKCAKVHKAAVQRYQSFRKRGENHEAFHKMFSKDGFSAVSHFFGLGIFSDTDTFVVPPTTDER